MKQLVVISGKGGTGKTTVTASLAALAHRPVLADCDVDAADLHLVLEPTSTITEPFSGGNLARIIPDTCVLCGRCAELCRFDAVVHDRASLEYRIDPVRCEGCGVCAWFCETDAIAFEPAINGRLMQSQTRFGPLAHAALDPGEENSGKLVTKVRNTAQELAARDNRDLILIDGSPGIGCPVISSLTGTDMVLAVTEPTISGRHDLARIMDLADHFGIPVIVAINKWDINRAVADEIERDVAERGATIAGRIRYDRQVVDAIMNYQTVVEYSSEGAAIDIQRIWEFTAAKLFQ